MIDTGDIDVLLGLDVGQGEHHATATKLHTALCTGQIALASAQYAIVNDWTTAPSSLHLEVQRGV
ncbi:hypothetical protein ACWGLP_27200 [Streptomyces lydicus]